MSTNAFDGAEDRKIETTLQGNRTFESNGIELLTDWSIPHFYFHVVTTYDILRNNGVEIGKRDYRVESFPDTRPPSPRSCYTTLTIWPTWTTPRPLTRGHGERARRSYKIVARSRSALLSSPMGQARSAGDYLVATVCSCCMAPAHCAEAASLLAIRHCATRP